MSTTVKFFGAKKGPLYAENRWIYTVTVGLSDTFTNNHGCHCNQTNVMYVAYVQHFPCRRASAPASPPPT